MNQVKFADCECNATDEDWELIGEAYYMDESGEGVDMVEYECQTCGEVVSSSVESERI